jgi:integrase
MASLMESYIIYRKASGRWSATYEQNLRLFDCHCSRLYPKAEVLTQEMVDGWCSQRITEKNNSCIARINVVSGFVRYLQNCGKTAVAGPIFPRRERQTYIPHAFTAPELENFFKACDSLPSTPRVPVVLLRRITVPIFFRLLYSSGIRTNEARMLLVGDVDLNQGILNIRHSKGPNQHYVALHDTMLNLLKRYDAALQALYPGREYFFPAYKGSCHTRAWVQCNFRELWGMYNPSYATTYELRHHYATENINQWIGEGFEFDSKLLYLSKSMGHSTQESTRYYYSLTPVMADILEKLSGQDFDDIVPEVDNEEGQ